MEHILTTERLVLRPIEDKDKDDIIRGVSDFAVAKWLSMVPHPYTGADAQWFIDHVKASPHGYWAITRPGQFLGTISIKPDLGYWLAPAHWGQGVISEAVRAFLKDCYGRFDLEQVIAEHFHDNPASDRVLRKVGFEYIGRALGQSAAREKKEEVCEYSLSRAALRTL